MWVFQFLFPYTAESLDSGHQFVLVDVRAEKDLGHIQLPEILESARSCLLEGVSCGIFG